MQDSIPLKDLELVDVVEASKEFAAFLSHLKLTENDIKELKRVVFHVLIEDNEFDIDNALGILSALNSYDY